MFGMTYEEILDYHFRTNKDHKNAMVDCHDNWYNLINISTATMARLERDDFFAESRLPGGDPCDKDSKFEDAIKTIHGIALIVKKDVQLA